MKLYKVLSADGRSCHGGDFQWSLPTKNEDGSWTPGDWTLPIEGEVVPCENAYHLCAEGDLMHWLGEMICEAEVEGDVHGGGDKHYTGGRVRLLRVCEHWNEKTARLLDR